MMMKHISRNLIRLLILACFLLNISNAFVKQLRPSFQSSHYRVRLDLQANLFLEQLKELSSGLKELQSDVASSLIPEKTSSAPTSTPVATTKSEATREEDKSVKALATTPEPPVATVSIPAVESVPAPKPTVAVVEPVTPIQETKPEPKVELKVDPVTVVPKVETKVEVKVEAKEEDIIRPAVAGKRVEPVTVTPKAEIKVEPVTVAPKVETKVEVKVETKEEDIIRPAVAGKVAPKPVSEVKPPVVATTKIETFDSVKVVSEARMPSEGVAVKDIPLTADAPVATASEIAKAQASIAKSFEAFAIKEEAPVVAPKKAKVASESAPIYLSEVSPELNKVAKGGEEGKEALGLFTAFKSLTGGGSEVKDEPKAAAPAKTTAAPIKPVEVKPLPVKSVDLQPVTVKPAAVKPTQEKPKDEFFGMLNFLKSDPGVMAASAKRNAIPATNYKPPVAKPEVVETKPAVKKDERLFGLLSSTSEQIKPAMATKKAVDGDSIKPAMATKKIVVDKPAAVAPVKKDGGLFGFLASAPAPEPVKTAVATKQASVAEPVKPAMATKPAAAVTKQVAEKKESGLFGFLASTSAPEPVKPAVVTKQASAAEPAKPAMATKPAAVAKPVAETKKDGGLFGFLASAPAPEPVKPAVVAKPAVEQAPVAKKESVEKKDGGIFGFLASTPAPEPVKPVVVAKPIVPAPAKKEGGLFGFLASAPVPAVVAKAAVVQAPVAKKESVEKKDGGIFGFLASTPAPEPVAPVATPAKSSSAASTSGGFFGIFGGDKEVSKPVTALKPPTVSASISGKATTTNQRSVVKVQSPVAPAKPTTPAAAVPKKEASSSASGGFFGMFSGSSAPAAPKPAAPKPTPAAPAPVAPKVTAKVVPKAAPVAPKAIPAAPKPAPVVAPKAVAPKPVAPVAAAKATPTSKTSMNVAFQDKVAKLLKNSQLRISQFQKSTNDYRSGVLTPQIYVGKLVTLFDADSVGSIVSSLVAELPERDLASKLQSAYSEISKKR